jgi:hypothetical protein
MEHRLVFAVVAKERDVFAEIHVFEVIGDKTSVATLYAFAELLHYVLVRVHFPKKLRVQALACFLSAALQAKACTLNFLFHHAAFRGLYELRQDIDLAAVGDLLADAFECLACI